MLLCGGLVFSMCLFTCSGIREVQSNSMTQDCMPAKTQGRHKSKTYLSWLKDPPCEVVSLAAQLVAEADEIAQTLSDSLPTLGDVDLIVAGSSYLDRYFVGFYMILARAEDYVSVKRISGASSGANAPFDMMLLGEVAALEKFLTFGLLGEKYHYVYHLGIADQRYFFKSIDWLFDHHADKLSALNDRMYVWMNCKVNCTSWNCKREHVSLARFDNETEARRAYRATGSVTPAVDVSSSWTRCIDGGAGEAFGDNQRAQITISPTTALGMIGAFHGYTMSEYAAGMRQGMHAAVEFLRTHSSRDKSIILCAQGTPCERPRVR
eukprot:TRINITY_DN94135_c0_g1_i1.p1 TRINITY_DN94135_c0_g1~~TRINITY_DN94135_c0_g1_i1.p1  ORF type:complete len:322 (-),score=56.29 TRINITY_DN94135_c0_g1_i1:57-1022(-)